MSQFVKRHARCRNKADTAFIANRAVDKRMAMPP